MSRPSVQDQRAAALAALDSSQIRVLPPGPRPARRDCVRQNLKNQGDGRRPLKGRCR